MKTILDDDISSCQNSTNQSSDNVKQYWMIIYQARTTWTNPLITSKSIKKYDKRKDKTKDIDRGW